MKKLYAIEIKYTDGKTKTVFEVGEDELEAIDKVYKYAKEQGKEILDVKVVE